MSKAVAFEFNAAGWRAGTHPRLPELRRLHGSAGKWDPVPARRTPRMSRPPPCCDRAGPLTRDERAVVQRHPMVGFDVLGQVPGLREVGSRVLYHHERHDGGGYPTGLAGDGDPARRARGRGRHRLLRDDARPVLQRRAHARRRRRASSWRAPARSSIPRSSPPSSRSSSIRNCGASTRGWPRRSPRGSCCPTGPCAAGARGRRGAPDGQRDAARRPPRAARGGGGDRRGAGPLRRLAVRLAGLPAVNEREGYAAGDALLAGAARKLRRAAARTGATAYRDGGNRLVVLAPGTTRRRPAGWPTRSRRSSASGPRWTSRSRSARTARTAPPWWPPRALRWGRRRAVAAGPANPAEFE